MKLFTCMMGIVTTAIIFHLSTVNIASAQSTPVTVDPADRQASIDFFKSQYKLSSTVTAGWTGNISTCNPGATSAAYRETVLRRANYFRSMAGLPPFTLNDMYTVQAQPAALISSANNMITHDPSPSLLCYSEPGAQAAVRANLALGVHGWDAVTAYVQDAGPSNYAAGHRRWLFYPQTQNIGTGDVPATATSPAANALYIVDPNSLFNSRPATRYEFVAWPPPGYVPHSVVFPRWSFALPGANFANATVAMTANGVSVSTAKEPLVNGYGENTLVWLPMGLIHNMAWPRPLTDNTYDVTINNVVVNGQSRSFNYRVVVVDINEPPTDIKLSASYVYENKIISTTVGYFTAVDPDIGDIFSYSLVAGVGDTDNDKFAMVGTKLKTKAIFDYESKSNYNIRVRVNDGRLGGTFEKAFVVTVKNTNDKPSDILLSSSTITENLPAKTQIGLLSAADQDTGNTFRYAFVSSTIYPDYAKFYIFGNSLKTNVILDYETKSSYSFLIRVYDNYGGYNTKPFTITAINDINGLNDVTIQAEQAQSETADAKAVAETTAAVTMEETMNQQSIAEAEMEQTDEVAFEQLQTITATDELVDATLMPAPQISDMMPQENDATLTNRVFLPVVNK